MLPLHTLQVSTGAPGTLLTPQQKRFNTLIRQIAQARQTLAAWHDHIAAYGRADAQTVQPLRAELTAARRQWVFALDALLGQRRWSGAERDTLSELVCDVAGDLLHARDDDEELKTLFARHAGVDFDTERQRIVLAMKDIAQAVTGLDLGDNEGIDTHDDLFERMQQGLQGRGAAEEAEEAERNARSAGRRKTAAQQRREDEALQATQSVREIFRKLASALHPDRESDPEQREVKTALMQKVNQAYAANDLLTLLELQLQIEQIDAGHIAAVSAQRLTHYNKVLGEQLRELKGEIERTEVGFQIDFSLRVNGRLKPHHLGQLIEGNSRQLRAELSMQLRDLRMLDDVAATRRWLKRQRQSLRDGEAGFDLW